VLQYGSELPSKGVREKNVKLQIEDLLDDAINDLVKNYTQ
jgi:hypothetical protein